tara:strand:+ start:47509 stop:51333 length:3825 start_codon:yes stop_codon:yes gene_type:complete
LNDPKKRTLDDLFLEAAELPPSEVAAFLDRHCGDDSRLRNTLEELLAADAAAQGKDFLESALFGDKSPEPDSSSDPGSTPIDMPSETARFQILRTHEQGGLGEVLIAFDHQLGREVAIKQIKPKWRDHEEARQRFLQEAEVTGRLEHPGVVPVYAMGSWDDGRQYYAMRFIEGETLKQKIASYHSARKNSDEVDSSQLQFRQLLGALVDVCNTMNYAHSRRILHRDLKPSNVMVGPYGETLIVDWGLAKQMDVPEDESVTAAFMRERGGGTGSTPTQVGGAVGTPQYMSPEQAGGRTDEVGRCTDIYLLGGILYQILTGQPPHSEESLIALLSKVSKGEFTPPRMIDADVAKPLDAICCKAMNAGVSKRYRSAAEMAADLERWMADEPVSVYQDEWTVRASRWGRRHRTLVVSGAVAAILVTVGTIVGSLVWNTQRTRQFEIQRERNLKEAELQNERQQRFAERAAAARIAESFADAEIRVDRFSSALSFLRSALDAIGDEPTMASDRERVRARSERIERLVQFYDQADYAHQQNYLSRDASGMMACKAALDAAGVWDHVDWWAHLPDEDLSAVQKEHLRESIYQQLLSLDGILIKSIGTRLSGDRQMRSASSFLTMLRRFIRTDAGKDEARAAMLVGKRIRNFRPAECERWFTGMARFRLGDGKRAKATELGPSRNAADAHSLGVLSLIASLDESFRFFYGGYQDEDDLQVAHDLFARSSSLRPDQYWTLLALAHSQALLAQRDAETSNRLARNRYASAIQTLGRCIALDPNNAFAYADRSAVYRLQADAVKDDTALDQQQRRRLETELLRLSLSDIERAVQMNTDQHWIHWHHGLSLLAVDQHDQAIESFLRAATEGYALSQTDNNVLIHFDDLHGREESADALSQLSKPSESDAQIATTLAAIRLNQGRVDDAAAAIAQATEKPPVDDRWTATAHVVNGMIELRRENWSEAESSFAAAESIAAIATDDPSGIATWLQFGIATCAERKQQLESALQQYERAQTTCINDLHFATCSLSRGRTLALAGRFDKAKDAVLQARQFEPACDLLLVAKPLVDHYRQQKRKGVDESQLDSIESLIRWIGKLPRASTLDFVRDEQDGEFELALLNEGFELGMAAYWSHPSGASWFNAGGDRSIGEVTTERAHSGQYSLHIAGDTESDLREAETTPGLVHPHGRTGQDFPAQTGHRYRISAWVRSKNLSNGALWLMASPQQTGIKILGGTYDWTRFVGEFQIPVTEDEDAGNVVNCRLEIVSTGSGHAWIDDLRIQRITPQ